MHMAYDSEKNRREMLLRRLNESKNSNVREDLGIDEQEGSDSSDQLWEYELLAYRKRKKLDQFYMIASVLGVLGFLISLFVLYKQIII